eukprot:scaffold109749_cov15-Tisochrysis_lutea.AAC.1
MPPHEVRCCLHCRNEGGGCRSLTPPLPRSLAPAAPTHRERGGQRVCPRACGQALRPPPPLGSVLQFARRRPGTMQPPAVSQGLAQQDAAVVVVAAAAAAALVEGHCFGAQALCHRRSGQGWHKVAGGWALAAAAAQAPSVCGGQLEMCGWRGEGRCMVGLRLLKAWVAAGQAVGVVKQRGGLAETN